MSDHEKEKDRIFVRAALEILVSKAPGQNLSV
jgi:hypothetical protein